jgi:hypothetical protein
MLQVELNYRFHYCVDLQVAARVLKLVITDLQGPQKDPGIEPHHGDPGNVDNVDVVQIDVFPPQFHDRPQLLIDGTPRFTANSRIKY